MLNHPARYVVSRYLMGEQNEGETDRIAPADRDAIKAHIVSLMIGVPSAVQVQLGEAVSIIADNDFPHHWEQLIPVPSIA